MARAQVLPTTNQATNTRIETRRHTKTHTSEVSHSCIRAKFVDGPMALSLRFPRQAIRGQEGRRKLRSMIETYFREGGQQLQISIASSGEMKDAQRNPEGHRDLMVRVGGFSAYFVELDRAYQDDMIARAELEL